MPLEEKRPQLKRKGLISVYLLINWLSSKYHQTSVNLNLPPITVQKIRTNGGTYMGKNLLNNNWG